MSATGCGTRRGFERRCAPQAMMSTQTRVTAEAQIENGQRVALAFPSPAGDEASALLFIPQGTQKPVPCVVFLHGLGMDGDFVERIAGPFLRAGFAIASFDQYTQGARELTNAGPVAQVRAFRARSYLTVADTRILATYLTERPDIDGERLYLLGASYGAIIGSSAVAFDERFRAVVLTYGGGDLPVLLRSDSARRELGFLLRPLVFVASRLLGFADPVHYVSRIAPRPVLFQNGTRDELIPTEAARRLHAAAAEPKTVVWYDSEHIGNDPAVVRQVLNDALHWLLEQEGREAQYRGVDFTEGFAAGL